jgi:hypothetical protein
MSRSIKLSLALAVLAVVLIPVAAVASHQFTDVPDSNIFHDDIAWMRDNNVTKGCNPPTNDKYCPSNTVTREQMAAFMRRLAVNKVVDAKTAINADMLDGEDPSHYETIAFGTTDETGQGTLGFFAGGPVVHNPIVTANVTAPSSGFVHLTYFASVVRSGLDMSYAVSVSTDDPTCAFSSFPTATWSPGSVDSGADWDAVSGNIVVPAAAGAHSYTLCGNGSNVAGDVGLVSAGVTGIFSTVGSTNATTTGAGTGGFGE